jgi:hypothetical protein
MFADQSAAERCSPRGTPWSTNFMSSTTSPRKAATALWHHHPLSGKVGAILLTKPLSYHPRHRRGVLLSERRRCVLMETRRANPRSCRQARRQPVRARPPRAPLHQYRQRAAGHVLRVPLRRRPQLCAIEERASASCSWKWTARRRWWLTQVGVSPIAIPRSRRKRSGGLSMPYESDDGRPNGLNV